MAFDSAYCRAIVQHYYKQRPFLLRLEVQFAFTLIPLACWWFDEWKSGAQALTAESIVNWLLIWFIAAAGGLLVTRWSINRRLKGKIDFGTEVTMTLSETGIEAIGQNVSGKWSWAAYPRSVRFPDGILLERAGVIRWLPDSAIQFGTPEQASQLVASKTDLRRLS
jgi:hypothetical protein